MNSFVHLRVHTEYSLVDSLLRVDALVDAVAEQRMPACAITDQGNVSALVKFYKPALSRGVKPIVGADVWVADSAEDREPARLTLLCQNRAGFKRLSSLLTKSAVQGPISGRNVLLKSWLEPAALDGLIGLSGGQHGELGRALAAGRGTRGSEVLAYWQQLLPGRYYVELQRLGRAGEREYLARAVEAAAAHAVPVVATNDVCFLERGDYEAHETRVCIAQGVTLDDPSRARTYSEQQYLRTPAEMAALFADLPEAVANTVEIAKRCSLEVDVGRVFLPDFVAEDRTPPRQLLERRSASGLEQRIAELKLPAEVLPRYRERLTREIDVICKMGFEGYFLIVADFIAWARTNNIPVGPGRGSGVGSLVAYALGITNLDPLAHDLLFERFLNPERVSLPDFDIDFCIDGRDRVIDYVGRRYGRERVAQIATYGTMAARAVVRDVGRALGMPYGYVDRIAKLIPFEIGITLDKAIADDEELRKLYENDEEIRGLIDLAKRLEGLARNVGTHAGGVVIAPQPITEYMPLYADADGALLTQLDKDDLEAIGLIKFDFLGLKTLTIIDKAVATINRARASRSEPPLNVDAIPVDDAKTYELLRQCRTTAVFQLESLGMRDLIKRLQPDRFDDLTAIVALFRPGPMQMADEFIERKHGTGGARDFLHPRLETTLKPTYGVILYQEQVMQIAQILAGYSLGGADLLRRAMGKKKPEEMAQQRAVFLKGATERGVEESRANHIFDQMETFAGYGFNKSHAAAYALIAYQTAWLKTHYPEDYMAAVLTADSDNTDRLVVLKDELKRMGIALEPPNVNASVLPFTVAGPKRISYGLGALKGVGPSAVEAIVAERAHGPYKSLVDLCRRVDLQKINRRVLEALAKSGGLDSLGANRATLMNGISNALQAAERSVHAQAAGQTALFGGDERDDTLEHVLTPVREWSKRERLEGERESLGLYLTGHPFDDFAEHCKHFTNGAIAKVLQGLPSSALPYHVRKEAILAGVVVDVRRRGNRVSIILDDDTERIEVTMFDEVFAQSKHVIAKHAVLIAEGQLRYDDFINGWRLTAKRVRSADEAIEEYARRLTIRWPSDGVGTELVRELQRILKPFTRGRCEVSIEYRRNGAEATLTLGEAWSVRCTRELRDQLTRLLGDDRLLVHYPKHFV
ncbi:MAG TPA: DNA polymerase III subunit alpha [Gammaproteobacteria bacterium]|nr:DNA polymerase III subunit alpha [Gammaproteobacteria bacterium]